METTDTSTFLNTGPTSDNSPERFINISAVVYVAVLSMIGTVGNTTVLYVYVFKFKPNPFNIFIIFLAACDILSNAILMPLDIVNMVLPSRFSGCKPLVVIATATALATGFTLVAIAVLRYNSICNPLKPNISTDQAKRICLICSVLGVCLSWPAAVLVTKIPDELEGDMFVLNCSTEHRFQHTIYPLLFYGFMFLLFVVVFITLVVLYGIIGVRLQSRIKYNRSKKSALNNKRPETNTNSETSGHGYSGDDEVSKNVCNDMTDDEKTRDTCVEVCTGKSDTDNYIQKKDELNSCAYTRESDMRVSSIEQILDTKHENINNTESSQKGHNLIVMKNKTKQFSISKTTFKVLFIVTVTFLVSYLPHLTLMIYEPVGSDLDVSVVGESFVGIFIRSYLISCVANPFIYGYYNKRFRDEANRILQKKLGFACCFKKSAR